MLLSYNKPVEVSSEQDGHPKNYATNEDIRTYWSAKTGDKGEWISMDLQKECTINAVADQLCRERYEIVWPPTGYLLSVPIGIFR